MTQLQKIVGTFADGDLVKLQIGRFRFGSVVSDAVRYHECPIDALAREMGRGGSALHYLMAQASVISDPPAKLEDVDAELHWGDRVVFEGRVFTVEPDHNHNAKLVPERSFPRFVKPETPPTVTFPAEWGAMSEHQQPPDFFDMVDMAAEMAAETGCMQRRGFVFDAPSLRRFVQHFDDAMSCDGEVVKSIEAMIDGKEGAYFVLVSPPASSLQPFAVADAHRFDSQAEAFAYVTKVTGARGISFVIRTGTMSDPGSARRPP